MYTIARAKESVKNGIRGYLLKDAKGNYVMKEVNRLPFYLEGEPGIGKTEIVKQIADELGIGYVSFSLTHHTRNSLLGLPVIKELEDGDKYTCYTMSEIIAKVLEAVEQGHKEGILLLDEFPCMSETIMPTMLAFLQTKNIGTHHLPEGWVIVLCGNPTQYNKSARNFDAAIMDRLRKLEIAFEPEVFVEYGEKIGLHPCIVEYLKSNPGKVYHYEKKDKNFELITCRGWENLSHMLTAYEALEQSFTAEDVKQYLKAEYNANDFYQYYMQYSAGLQAKDVENILKGIRIPAYAKIIKEKDYNLRWRSVQSLLAKLSEELAEYREQVKTLSDMTRLKETIEKNRDEITFGMRGHCTARQIINDAVNCTSFETAEREIIGVWKKWAADKNKCYDMSVCYSEGCYDAGVDILLQIYAEWRLDEQAKCDLLGQQASEKLTHIMTFTQKIDSEKALMEMLFCKLNEDKDILKLLSTYPNDLYLKECKKRYGVSA